MALAVAVAAVVVLALLLTGVIDLSSSPSSHAGGGNGSYSSAVRAATPVAQGASGGPWTLVLAEGIDLTQGVSTHPPDGCTFSGGSGLATIPSWTGNYSSGYLSAWFLGYLNPNSTSFLLIEVSGSATTLIGVATGGGCLDPIAGSPALPPSSINSTRVASEMLGLPTVKLFVGNFSAANVEMTLGSYEGGIWSVSYSTCGIPGLSTSGPSTGATALVELAATTGKVLESVFNPATTCQVGGGTPIGSAFAAGNPTEFVCPPGDTYAVSGCTAGDHAYSLSIEGSTIELGDVLFEVHTSAGIGDPVNGSGGFSILSSGGGVLAQSASLSLMVMTQSWSQYGAGATGPTYPLTAFDSIVVDVGTATPTGTGLTFVAEGYGPYSGTTAPLALP